MRLAVPKEVASGETRVAAIPQTVMGYVRAGIEVAVEAGAGAGAWIDDEAYRAAGAAIAPDAAALLAEADVVVKIQPPQQREADMLKNGSALVSMLMSSEAGVIQTLADRGVSAFALELVPRIARAQSMDVLSSMASLAGYKAVLLAADTLGKIVPMMMTAAGTLQPAGALVIGAGVAGLAAVAQARKLGAVVWAIDTRPAVREQVESLGARFVPLEVSHEAAEGEGGYAKDLGEEFYRGEQGIIAPHLKDADFVVTTAQIPRRRAPLLISEVMVATMRPGSVIIDLAANTGGNCAITSPDQWVERHGVKVYGPSNLPAQLPVHASTMFARNVAAFIAELCPKGRCVVDTNNEILRAMLVTHAGRIVHEPKSQAVATGKETRT
jgi:NAD(P) transhydrogenase subunit alpha